MLAWLENDANPRAPNTHADTRSTRAKLVARVVRYAAGAIRLPAPPRWAHRLGATRLGRFVSFARAQS